MQRRPDIRADTRTRLPCIGREREKEKEKERHTVRCSTAGPRKVNLRRIHFRFRSAEAAVAARPQQPHSRTCMCVCIRGRGFTSPLRESRKHDAAAARRHGFFYSSFLFVFRTVRDRERERERVSDCVTKRRGCLDDGCAR